MTTQTDRVRDVIARSSPVPGFSDERLKKVIMEKLKSIEPSVEDVPDFSVTDGVVRFWGTPPTAEEIDVVFRALRAATGSVR